MRTGMIHLYSFRESDINFSWNHDEPDSENEGILPPKVCGYVKENNTKEEPEEPTESKNNVKIPLALRRLK